MRQHAVTGAISLYQAGTLTLEQAAGYAGVTPKSMGERLQNKGVEVRGRTVSESGPAVAGD